MPIQPCEKVVSLIERLIEQKIDVVVNPHTIFNRRPERFLVAIEDTKAELGDALYDLVEEVSNDLDYNWVDTDKTGDEE